MVVPEAAPEHVFVADAVSTHGSTGFLLIGSGVVNVSANRCNSWTSKLKINRFHWFYKGFVLQHCRTKHLVLPTFCMLFQKRVQNSHAIRKDSEAHHI